MHPECEAYVKETAVPIATPGMKVLEIGSLDINGSIRGLFSEAEYVGIDIQEGAGVDYKADATIIDEIPIVGEGYDLVLCLEVLEHTPWWREIVTNAGEVLKVGGTVVVTAACDPRPAHSAVHGFLLEEWDDDDEDGDVEYYRNIDPKELIDQMESMGFTNLAWKVLSRGDVQVTALKGGE